MGWNREGTSILNEVDRVSPMEYSGVGQAMWKPGERALKQGEQTVQSPGDGSGLDMFEDGKETADFRAEQVEGTSAGRGGLGGDGHLLMQVPKGRCDDSGFPTEGNGGPWQDFEQKRDLNFNRIPPSIVSRIDCGGEE